MWRDRRLLWLALSILAGASAATNAARLSSQADERRARRAGAASQRPRHRQRTEAGRGCAAPLGRPVGDRPQSDSPDTLPPRRHGQATASLRGRHAHEDDCRDPRRCPRSCGGCRRRSALRQRGRGQQQPEVTGVIARREVEVDLDERLGPSASARADARLGRIEAERAARHRNHPVQILPVGLGQSVGHRRDAVEPGARGVDLDRSRRTATAVLRSSASSRIVGPEGSSVANPRPSTSARPRSARTPRASSTATAQSPRDGTPRSSSCIAKRPPLRRPGIGASSAGSSR